MSTRRPPARRGGGRRPKKKDDGAGLLLVLGGAVVAVMLVLAVLRWLAAHVWVVVVLALIGAGVAALSIRRLLERQHAEQARRLADLERQRRLRLTLTGPGGLDHMRHDAFEFAVRDLLLRDGCTARRVGQGGDQSADVLATDPMGRTWVLQCKHKQDPVGGAGVSVGVLYSLVGANERVHKAEVPVVVTNGRFTKPSQKWGAEQNVLLVDRELLGRWASSGRPLWELLRIPLPRGGQNN
ncbi:restriction endonuclease [Kitasatospora sp. NPDC059973]|uniref:restriction endonuclease n=1 Tax=Kitasatospora sp. NPDC059973 TaxID=3347020 RepID=UPI0036B5174A